MRGSPLVFLDLNAISPATARSIASLLANHASHVQYIDGGIIGGPPHLDQNSADDNRGGEWDCPSIPVSGPIHLENLIPSGTSLARLLHISHVSEEIGAAAGLKMCFAALSKGFTALAIQSFTTAHNLGILPELKAQLAEHNPSALKRAEGGLPGMCPKAYRWVHEMEEIADTFEVDGGFDGEESSFRSIARVFDFVANQTVLGEEKAGMRERGKTAEEVARWIGEGTKRRKEKVE